MNNCEVRCRLYYILYTNRATPQLFGNEQLRGELPSVLYTIYKSSYPTVVRKWTIARWAAVCIIYYIQIELPRSCSEMNNCEVSSRLYYILYTNRATPQLFGNEQLRGEVPSVLYTIYKSSYPAVVRKWTIAKWAPVCIINYKQIDLPHSCSETNICEVRCRLYIYYIQIELPRSCSEMNNCEVRCRLYYILYTNRATPQLFGNEQLRGEVPSVLYTIYKSSYPATVRRWTIARWGTVCILYYIQIELPCSCSKMNNCKVSSRLYYILNTNRATPQLFGNEQMRGEVPSVLYTIYKSCYPAVVRKWTIVRWAPVCIIYYIQIALLRSFRKWTIARWAPVYNIYYIQIGLPHSCSEMNNCEVRCRLYYILYTNRATPQLFGNEQLRGEVPSVLYTIYKSSYPAVVRIWTIARWAPVCIIYCIQIELPCSCSEMNNCEVSSRLYYILCTNRATPQLIGNEQLRGEVQSVIYTLYKSSYPAVLRKWTIARWTPVCIIYYIHIEVPRTCSEMNNCEVSSRLYYILYTNRATLQLFGNKQLEGELPSVLYAIYKSSYFAVVRKWTIARWAPVCIIYYIHIELPRSCSEMKNCKVSSRLYYILYTKRATPKLIGNEQLRGELPSALYTIYKSRYPAVVRKWTIARWSIVCIIYYIQIELPRSCSEMNNCEVSCRLYYILYTNRATPQLFGNEQLRGELPSVLYTIYKSSYPAVDRKWTIARWARICIIYYVQIELPCNCWEMNNCEVRCRLYYILYTNRAIPQLFGNEQLRGEVPSVLYTIYKSSYPAVVRKWTIARWGAVCIIYYIQIELPRSCSEMNNCEVSSRLYYILYTNRATPQLFGNHQLRGELPSVLYSYIQIELPRSWLGNEQLRGEVPSVL